MSQDSVLTVSPEAVPRYRYRWLVFAVMLVGEVMDVLDATITHVAAPALEREFGASPIQLQWAIGIYALAMGAALIVGGRMGDVYGKRRMFIGSMSGFALASLLCAVAPNILVLIAARLLQGLAGALLLPQGFALLREVFEPDELTKALAIFGPVLGVAAVAGPVIGGAIVHADLFGLGWRFAFVVNLPLALTAILVAWRCLPRDQLEPSTGRIDLGGAVLVALACGLLVLPLIQGQESTWTIWRWLCLLLSGLAYTAFVVQQCARLRQGRIPLVDPDIFTRPAFSAGICCMGLFFSGFIGAQLAVTLYLQLAQGYTALQAGLASAPFAAGVLLGSALAGGFLLERIGRRVLQIGALAQIASGLWLWMQLGATEFSLTGVLPPLTLLGVGGGMIIASLINIVISAVDEDQVGSGSGTLAAMQSISSAAGIAVLGGAFFSGLEAELPEQGLRMAIALQIVLVTAFFLVTFALPARSRPETGLSPTLPSATP